MNIQKILENPRFRLETMEPAGVAVVNDFLQRAPENLPVKYLHFMQATDGARGNVPYDSGYLEIWPLEETLDKQTGYGMKDSLSGFFAFGSDGSGRRYVFDLRESDGAAVYSVADKTPAEETLEPIAASFSQFLEHIALMGSGA
jgi:hypothetical protein